MLNKQYYPSINALRGIAALMVCVYHFTNYSDINGTLFSDENLIPEMGRIGILGVYIFFIITGFIIPFSLMKYNFQLKQIHKCFAKRWVRIEIPYLASISLALLVSALFALRNNELISVNLSRIVHPLFYTTPFSNHEWYNPIYWTLAIEMQFYIVIALLYPLLSTKNKFIQLMTVMIFCLSSQFIQDTRLVFHYAVINLASIDV